MGRMETMYRESPDYGCPTYRCPLVTNGAGFHKVSKSTESAVGRGASLSTAPSLSLPFKT